jgi:hypothetical protein
MNFYTQADIHLNKEEHFPIKILKIAFQMEKNEMGGTGSVYEGEERLIQSSGAET